MSRRLPWVYPALLLTGCVPVTEPLSDATKAEPDRKLLGMWGRDNESAVVTIDAPEVKGHPKGLMRAVYDGMADDPQNAFWFFTTTIGKQTYATVYVDTGGELKFADFRKEGAFAEYAKGKDRRYFIFKYALDGDKLVVDGGSKTAVDDLMREANITALERGIPCFKTPEGWLAKYLQKTGPDKVFDGSNAQRYTRAKK